MKCKEIEFFYCPWCGERKLDKEEKEVWLWETLECRCANCGKISRLKYLGVETAMLVVLCLLVVLSGKFSGGVVSLEYAHSMGFLPLIAYYFVQSPNFPLKRAGAESLSKKRERTLGRALVRWYPYKRGGLGFAHLRLLNNMIFPVCFLDEKGTPVSQTLCVRFKKGLGFFWNRTRITLISDHLWKSDKEGKYPWEKAEKFVIFNHGEMVGEGEIRKRG